MVEVTVGGSLVPFNYTVPTNSDNVAQGLLTLTLGINSSGTITGGPSSLLVQGNLSNNVTFLGGTGPETMFGGNNSTLFTGNSISSFLMGGAYTTLPPDQVQASLFATGSGNSTLVAGTGTSTMDGTQSTGTEAFYTDPLGSVLTNIAMNNAADTVIGASGVVLVHAGTGADVFGFVLNHTGHPATETIYGFGQNSASTIVFDAAYGAHPIVSESASSGSDTIVLTDGTTIILDGIDHKVFNGLGS